ncbi:type I signal peptidase SipX [Listeria welshimeri]|uniref:type I signal peptidase SipX n=1 Tax=Listeria welshimeri TaxID=1643 RepID=UPI00162338AB|nr:type I signal peptidase SipX [Listeria welshimeri]MBC1979870.1 type I signal peptidase SipX [Listeria welshimeri]MBF2340269.1 type I signal peptidase SipX [Listeria welshimeri]MBF2352586.1 type I signal peptidase SipX [Listeria welshimeri]MBF2367427.1 type I signal peptidase SipX [Listeria welshimeri]
MKSEKNFFSGAFGWIKIIIIALVLAFGIRYFLISPVTVNGASMNPTLHDGEHLFINKVSDPKRYDIIVFPAPDEENAEYIKRVIGLPGDKVEYKEDQLYINDKKYDEPYLDSEKDALKSGYLTTDANGDPNFTMAEIKGSNGSLIVPEGQLFVLGDNRQVSKDSRYIGFISQESVLGKVISFGKSLKR